MMELSQQEVARFARHFPVIGLDGQLKLKNAKVLSIGAGGLGAPALLYLAASGIGHIGIVDGDEVDISNLQRQVLFHEQQVGQNKAQSAQKNLHQLNSSCVYSSFPEFLNEENAEKIISAFDVVLDASDNFEARYLVNRVCRKLGKPLVSASIFQFDAQISTFNYQDGPCYECLYPAPPPGDFIPNCAQGGVLGVLPGVAGTIQATEVLKILLGLGETLSGKLLSIDLLHHHYKTFEVDKKPTCCADSCSQKVTQKASEPVGETIDIATITAKELAQALIDDAQAYYLIDVRQPYEREICHIGGELMPVDEIETHVEKIPGDKTVVVYCKGGIRGNKAAQFLSKTHANILNLEGGILAWIDDVDDSLMRY